MTASNQQKIEFHERLLVTQPFHNSLYRESDAEYFPRLYKAIMTSCALQEPQKRFDLEQSPRFPVEVMGSNPMPLSLLELFVRLTNAKVCLEIGCFIGLSAMSMATALPPGGKVHTIEKFDEFAAVANRNFAANGLADRIELHLGDAIDVLPGLLRGMQVDLAFIDGNKERYLDYFRLIEPSIRRGGIMIFDDATYHGDVLNDAPVDPKGSGVKAMLDEAGRHNEFHRSLLPIGNGLLLMLKK
ncbi:O-methyltransferase [Undibacter mobilis]|uniref:O-methyltransferase n=1 Tax=Undibacter mobilis TaxID=2292256 RepID=A0A371B6X8_9BRAD|nr:O-methyltransferase [Undibacter mobilis]RDV03151.1 O-methyltransferase [Undibacter mobilis]